MSKACWSELGGLPDNNAQRELERDIDYDGAISRHLDKQELKERIRYLEKLLDSNFILYS